MELLEFLGGVEVLRGLERPQLKAIIPCCQRRTYRNGSFLFREDEEANHLWAVISGEVDLRYTLPGRDTGGEMTISRINSGRVFGWSSLVPPHLYRLSAFCATKDCEVLQMGRSCLAKLFSEDTEVGYRVMANISQVIAARFQALQDEIAFREGSDLLFKSDW
jgi:CRP-like cAMP-binding protein